MSLLGAVGQLINGRRYDSSSVEITILPTGPANGAVGKVAGIAAGALGVGSIFQGITEISYSDKLEPGEHRAIGTPKLLGMTRGVYSTEASMTMYKEDAAGLIEALSALGGYGEVAFQITVVTAEAGASPITDTLEGVRITSIEDSVSQGGDPLTVAFELKPLNIKRNGKSMVGESGGVVGNLLP